MWTILSNKIKNNIFLKPKKQACITIKIKKVIKTWKYKTVHVPYFRKLLVHRSRYHWLIRHPLFPQVELSLSPSS